MCCLSVPESCSRSKTVIGNPTERARGFRTHYGVTFVVLATSATTYVLLQSLVIPALPEIQRDFHTSETSVSWVLTAFLVTASIATPITGRLGDTYGKERVLFAVLVLLATGTLMSAVASSMILLVAGRAVQGVAGGMFPLAFAIIRDEFPRERVASGIGVTAALIGLGGAAGAVLAGPIVASLSFHWLFWLPLFPITVAAIATRRYVPRSPVRAPGRPNLAPVGLMSAGLLMVLIALSESVVWGWASTKTIALASAGLIILTAWVWRESRSSNPLVDIGMMRIRGVWTTNIVAFLFGLGLYASFLLIPQFAQEPASTGYGLGVSLGESGLILLPSTFGLLATGALAGILSQHVGPRQLLLAGAGITAVGFAILTLERSQIGEIYTASALLGVGEGLTFGALANLIVQNVPHEHTGVATSVNTVSRTVGGAVGGQVAAALLAASVVHAVPTNDGFTMAFGFCLAGVLASLLIACLVPRDGASAESGFQAAVLSRGR
jgi:EmrB/QacA subfamily drug resistance transporter